MVAAKPKRRPLTKPSAGPALVSHVVAADGQRIPSDSLDRLEQLDDTVFAALSGDAGALDEAAEAWREAQAAVDNGLLNETRAHYVRRARSRWRRSQKRPGEQLAVGFAALEILGLLSD
ncbi:hypothetical protein MalM25_00810 [Planctomycetes bacterium MalM25]|nr:hypothetical protein MalM25_00810 [Planctomycetes bacterium MalM25]